MFEIALLTREQDNEIVCIGDPSTVMFDICDVVTVCGVLGYVSGDKPVCIV